MRGVSISQPFHGGVIYLDAVEHSWAWAGSARRPYEQFDRPLQDRLLALSRDADRLIDIGCNIGAMSLNVLLRNPRIRATCIDPNRRAVDLLRRSLRRNRIDRAEVITAAVATTEGSAHFDPTGSVTGHIASAGEVVPTIAFAPLLSRYLAGERCLVKLDVEGFETQLLPQLPEARGLERCTLVVELHPLGMNGVGDPAACVAQLRRSGADIAGLDGAPFVLGDVHDFQQAVATWPDRSA